MSGRVQAYRSVAAAQDYKPLCSRVLRITSRLHQCQLTQYYTNQMIIIGLSNIRLWMYREVMAGGRISFSWFVSNVYAVLKQRVRGIHSKYGGGIR
jgi:hypothetical protein